MRRVELRTGTLEIRTGTLEIRTGTLEIRTGALEIRTGTLEEGPEHLSTTEAPAVAMPARAFFIILNFYSLLLTIIVYICIYYRCIRFFFIISICLYFIYTIIYLYLHRRRNTRRL